MLRLVPFNDSWPSATGESGAPLLDIHAIYRRPSIDSLTLETRRDSAGFILWDLTGGLPVRHHLKWERRNFQYVTLAGTVDVVAVSKPELAQNDCSPLPDWRSYLGQHLHNQGPWDPAQYMRDMTAERAAAVDELKADIAELGKDRAEAFRQRDDPEYQIPAEFLLGLAGGAATASAGSAVVLTLQEKQALSRATRKIDQGKPLTELESAVLGAVQDDIRATEPAAVVSVGRLRPPPEPEPDLTEAERKALDRAVDKLEAGKGKPWTELEETAYHKAFPPNAVQKAEAAEEANRRRLNDAAAEARQASQ